MTAAFTALEIGAQYIPLALGIYLSLIVLSLPDLTIEGSFGLGGATCAAVLQSGGSPWLAVAAAMAAGAAAGLTTGSLHVFLRMNTLLASILVTAACWSICLFVMGGANVALIGVETLFTKAQGLDLGLTEANILVGGLASLACVAFLLWLLSTSFGASVRATGLNIQTSRAIGIRTEMRQMAGLGVANALVGLSGALVVQQQGFMDVSIQVGTLVVGIAALVMGRTIIRSDRPVLALAAVVLGVLVYRFIVAWTLENGGSANSLRMVTSIAVIVVLVARSHGSSWARGISASARAQRRRIQTDYLEADRVSPIL
ncbi:ABC transporter permease [Nocardioides humi]|uniref:ABC transporter permease n=1 Tax=Nocardioides humi TaxID=449461 RepID=A0ABN1ZZL9_9ACTN|nr:ABC transporter permease [Nocardioides humi]